MAISVKVTHVWWSKSPSRKPVMSDARIRLGLLIKNDSIHRPEAICQSSKKPPMMAMRMSVTRKPCMEKAARAWVTFGSLVVPA